MDRAARTGAGRALLWGAGVTVAAHVVLFAAADGLPPLAPGAWPDLGATLVNLVVLLAAAGLVLALGWSGEPWFRSIRPRRPWLLVPPLAVALLPLLDGVRGSATTLLSSALLFAVLGMNEELVSRGVVQHLLEPLGPVGRVLWVGALFGLGHVLSAVWFSRPVDDTVAQVISATAFGIGYAGLRLHVVSIWPLAALHGLNDWTEINSPGAVAWWVQLLVAVLLAGWGLHLARTAPSRGRLAVG